MRRASRNRLLCAPPTDRPCSFVIFVFNLTLNGVVLGQYTGHGDKPGSAAYMVRFPGYHHMLLAQRAPSGWRQASLPGFSPWDCPWGGCALRLRLVCLLVSFVHCVQWGKVVSTSLGSIWAVSPGCMACARQAGLVALCACTSRPRPSQPACCRRPLPCGADPCVLGHPASLHERNDAGGGGRRTLQRAAHHRQVCTCRLCRPPPGPLRALALVWARFLGMPRSRRNHQMGTAPSGAPGWRLGSGPAPRAGCQPSVALPPLAHDVQLHRGGGAGLQAADYAGPLRRCQECSHRTAHPNRWVGRRHAGAPRHRLAWPVAVCRHPAGVPADVSAGRPADQWLPPRLGCLAQAGRTASLHRQGLAPGRPTLRHAHRQPALSPRCPHSLRGRAHLPVATSLARCRRC